MFGDATKPASEDVAPGWEFRRVSTANGNYRVRRLLLGVLLGTLGPILFARLRNRLGGEEAAPTAAPVDAERSSEPSDRPQASPDNLSVLTSAELYRRAQAAGIAGRSGMSKAQLIAALQAINDT